ncbi:hypothetical protein WICPIJ_005477 [Wickerhamomyces pijperi]|uniref:Clu domain-containing protein n=1 Tax=Wickerhamomyces pijperi TaxID=599730 RepID=A0A9P8Q5M3_WICPI|nr:hypothetical protein WICPIJ_005477 [Wickerhamomyces pijperi]
MSSEAPLSTDQAPTEQPSVVIKIAGASDLVVKTYPSNTIGSVSADIQNVESLSSFNLATESGEVLPSEVSFAELIKGPSQSTVKLGLKNKPYTEKSITEHVAYFRQSIGLTQGSQFGINAGISKFGGLALDILTPPAATETEAKEKEKDTEVPTRTEEESAEVASIISQFFTPLPENYFVPSPAIKPAVASLFFSTWNPVPLSFRSRGHLVYLTLQTLEGETYHITGATTGFFVSKSTNTRFDPTPKDQAFESFTLFQLISKISKQFVNQVKNNQEKATVVDPTTYLAPSVGSLANPWMTKTQQAVPSLGHTEFDDANTVRDYNEEYQALRDTETDTIQENVAKEDALAKASDRFTQAAVKGALAVLNGAVAPINPEEAEAYHIFLHNNIFYSFGADVGAFLEKGGSDAARAASNQDLQAIKYLSNLQSADIHTLLTTIVDFAGKRVIAQTPVPGLFNYTKAEKVVNEATGETETLEPQPLTNIVYGLDEATGSVKSNAEFVEALQPFKKALHFQSSKTEEGELVTNKSTKGLVGTDGRKYLIELHNSTPVDIEFVEAHFNPESELSYPHAQAVVRMEAVQSWWSSQINKLITEEAAKRSIDLSAKVKEGEKLPEFSVKDEDVTFTVDAFEAEGKEDANVRALSKYITETLIPSFLDQYKESASLLPSDGSSLSANLHKSGINLRYLGHIAKLVEERIVSAEEEAANNLKSYAEINAKFDEDRNGLQAIIEANAKKAHEEGATYKLSEDPEVKKLEKYEETDPDMISSVTQYKSLLALLKQEMVARASKHVLRQFAEELPSELVPHLVSHFHNALLGYKIDSKPEAVIPHKDLYSQYDLQFTKETAESIRALVSAQVQRRFRHTLSENWIESLPAKSLQREIAIKFGIQWELREYFLTAEAREQFEKENAPKKKKKNTKSQSPEPTTSAAEAKVYSYSAKDVTMIPVVKTTSVRSTTAEQIFETGRAQVTSEDETLHEEGFSLLSDAIAVYEQVYGAVHPEVQRAYSIMAQLYSQAGKKIEAAYSARRAATIAERVFGLDSYEVLMSLMNLAYLESDAGSVKNALRVYARVSQLWQSMNHGYNLTIVTIMANITATLQNEGFMNETLALTSKLLKVSEEIYGEKSYTGALLKFRSAFIRGLEGKFAQSIKDIQEALALFRELASTSHFMTRQALTLERQVTEFKMVEAQNEKIAKEIQEKTKKEEALKQKENISSGKKKIADGLSVEETLAFVLGNGNNSAPKKKGPALTPSSKKGKKKNAGKK